MKKLLLLLTLAFSIGCLFMVTSVTEAKTAASTKKTSHAKMVSAYRNFFRCRATHLHWDTSQTDGPFLHRARLLGSSPLQILGSGGRGFN